MAEVREKETFINPYVVQMDKFADSLIHLSKTFLTLEEYKGTFSKEEIEEMFLKVTDKVCENCEKKEWCLGENRVHTYQMLYEILCTVEEFGAELNVELKRSLQKRCIRAPRFLRETLETFENMKKIMMWSNKIVQNREGYAQQLNHFAKMIQQTTRELDAGIFEDEHLEKRLKTQLKKGGARMLSSVFYMTNQGKYEIHLTVKSMKGHVIPTKELASVVGTCTGRVMTPQMGERPLVGEEYCTVACVESARFHTLQGVAKIGKGCSKISGDTFLMTDLPGSGEEAFRESKMVVEMLEELLEAGFPVTMAVQLMNTALVIAREEIRFSTIDASLFDLYNGTCEFVKAGASTTFIKRKDKVETITSSSLPVGVVRELELEPVERSLEDGDYVVMVTDGVLDALPVGEQETLMGKFIEESNIVNPKELAHHILEQVLEWTEEVPVDDMTVLVIGIWRL